MYLFKTPRYLGKPPLEDECGGRRAPPAITSYQRSTAWHRTSQRNCGIQQSISKNTIWRSLACMGFNNREHTGQLCSCPGQTARGSYSEIRNISSRLSMSGKRLSGLINRGAEPRHNDGALAVMRTQHEATDASRIVTALQVQRGEVWYRVDFFQRAHTPSVKHCRCLNVRTCLSIITTSCIHNQGHDY